MKMIRIIRRLLQGLRRCVSGRNKQRAVSITVAAVILTNTLSFSGLTEILDALKLVQPLTVHATEYEPIGNFPNDTHDFNWSEINSFLSYCYYYQQNSEFAAAHKNDTIHIAAAITLDQTYCKLGTEANPFGGRVIFGSSGSYTIQTKNAFFAWLSDSAQLGASNDTGFTLKINRTAAVAAGASEPLLADHVVAGDGTGSWHIEALSGSQTYSGVIGEMCDSGSSHAKATLDFTNNSAAAVEFNAASGLTDAGAVCGKMAAGSELTLTYTGTFPNVTSASGNAGGLVGTMGAGAKLKLSAAPASYSPNVTASGYAGGLVGDMSESAEITNHVGSALSITVRAGAAVSGTTGAGGFYGHYGFTANQTIDLTGAAYLSSATVSGGFCGGLYGVLETSGDLTITSGATFAGATEKPFFGSGCKCFGGVIGKLETTLTKTVLLENLKVKPSVSGSYTACGGVIGCVDSAAYIKVKDVQVEATGFTGTSFGGVIGETTEAGGVFVDLGNFKLKASSFKGGGVVGNFRSGVLRLSGTTDMSEGKPTGAVNCGQLVGQNDNVLVYALGPGNDASPTQFSSGWKFLRADGANADDLGTWGEVVRIADIETYLLEADTETAHTVTLKAAVTSMTTPLDFVKTALNIQLNQGSDYDCLKFTTGTANQRSTLLAGNSLAIGANISLAGTGITGLMRDGGTVDPTTGTDTIGKFTGTLDGTQAGNADHPYKITLATGEAYGLTHTGAAVDANTEGAGQIYRHSYTGLFAVIGDGATAGTVSNLAVEGNIFVRNRVDGMNIGGIAACNGGNVTLTGVQAKQTITYQESSGITGTESAGKNIGGLIGFVGANGTITLDGKCVVGKGNSSTPDIILKGYHRSWIVYGGAIGKVTAAQFQIDIGTKSNAAKILTMQMNADVSGITSTESNSDCGGLIGHITKAGSYGSRKVNINNLKYENCTVANSASGTGGGLLGYSWLNATVDIQGMTVTSAEIKNFTTGVTAGGNSAFGAMCYAATGKWTVDSLTVTALTVTGGASDSVGMLVNKAYTEGAANDDGSTNYTGALYLDVLCKGYTLTSVTLPVSPAKYDEIAAYSAKTAADILTGGAGIISVNMNSARAGTDVLITTTGTYQNQTSYTKYNDTARYYYNLDKMSNADDGQNLLLWSAAKYVHPSIAYEFICESSVPGKSEKTFGTTLITQNKNDQNVITSVSLSDTISDINSGGSDMTGLSFYPLANADGLTIGDLTLTLDYADIRDTAETVFTNSNTDSYVRDPGENTNINQHYLMHSGLFIDLSAGSTLTVSGALSLNGNFLETGNYKGVLISGTMYGTLDTSAGSVLLNGITPNVATGYLLINNIVHDDPTADPPELKLHHVSYAAEKYTTTAVTQSLIGPAYGSRLKMEFKYIKLPSATGAGDTKIFSASTLVYSIRTDLHDEMKYTFTWNDDWGDADEDGNPDHNVTYGKEITGSLEYANKEQKYTSLPGSTPEEKKRYYVNATTEPDGSTGVTDFSSGYLPYVYQSYNTAVDENGYYFREIKVNVEADGLTTGCGTYNDPYVIGADELIAVSKYLQTGEPADLGDVNLPNAAPADAHLTSGDRWCDGTHEKYSGNADTKKYSFTSGGTTRTWEKLDVQKYLAAAYYQVSSLTLEAESGFMGLGGTEANTAFRGVIVGAGTGATITNKTQKPFINVSNGSVVKNITVQVGADISVSQENVSYTDNKTIKYYTFGYGTDDTANHQAQYYGGMIGEIMGGDNIIDNSYVKFGSHTVTLSGGAGTTVPVGGFVGVVVYGGLIFKNMTAEDTVSGSTVLRANNTGLTVYYKDTSDVLHTDNNLAANTEAAKAAIYVNPLVGRVINGYAVNETEDILETPEEAAAAGHETRQVKTPGRFTISEDGTYHDDNGSTGTQRLNLPANDTAKAALLAKVAAYQADDTQPAPTAEEWEQYNNLSLLHSLKNGKKHYTVADINKSETNKLNVAEVAGDTDGEINVPNAQALFVLSLITQSTAGTAATADGEYTNSLAYGTYVEKINNVNVTKVYGMSHNGAYGDVGTDTASSAACSDYTSYAQDDTAAKTAIPYIIRHYTKAEDDVRTVALSIEEPVVTSYTSTSDSVANGTVESETVISEVVISSTEITTTTTTTAAAGGGGASVQGALAELVRRYRAADSLQTTVQTGTVFTTTTTTAAVSSSTAGAVTTEPGTLAELVRKNKAAAPVRTETKTETSISYSSYVESSVLRGTEVTSESVISVRVVVTEETTNVSELFTGAVSDLDGADIVICNTRDNSTKYLQCNNYATSGRVAQPQQTDFNLGTVIHFTKQQDGTFQLSFDRQNGDTTTKYYLKLVMTDSANGRGGLYLVTSDASNFTIESISTDKWGLKDVTLEPDLYINNDKGTNGFRSYKKNGSGSGYDAGNQLTLYKIKKYLVTTTTTYTTKKITTSSDSTIRYITHITKTVTTNGITTNYYPIYPARCVTSTAGYYNINLTAGVDYALPDSYRGLGCVGLYDSEAGSANKFSIKLNKFDGKGCEIDADIYINKYQTDNYFNVLHAGGTQSFASDTQIYQGNGKGGFGLSFCHGIGLFDSVIMKGATSEIGYFTLTGSVNTEIFSNSYNDEDKELNFVDSGEAGRVLWLSSGGVCGWSTNGVYANFTGIALNDLTVNGSGLVGGLLGFSGIGSTTVKVIIKQCSADEISLKMSSANNMGNVRQSRNGMGAFVGKVQEGAVVIYGTEHDYTTKNGVQDVNNDLTKYSEVRIKSFGFATDQQYYTSTGGLVGFAGHCCQAYDMKVTSVGDTVTIGNDKVRFSGGIVGGMQSYNENTSEKTCLAYFRNCTVENLDIAGEYAGGFYGGKWDSAWTPYSITFDNCKMRGKDGNNSITASYIAWDQKGNELPCAGGLVGRGLVKTSADENDCNILVKDCVVSNYNITAADTASTRGYAGGFLGYCSSNAANSTITCYIHDSAVENCTIGASGTNAFGGGAIGWVNPKNAAYVNKMLGYNIKLQDITPGNTNNMGAWIGWLSTNDKTTRIQFTGIAIYGTGFSKNIGNWTVQNNQTNTNTSFVFADYDGMSYGDTTTSRMTPSGDPVYTLDADSKTILKTYSWNETVDGKTENRMQVIKYSYSDEPAVTDDTSSASGWSESGGNFIRIAGGKQYVYSVTETDNEIYSLNGDDKIITRQIVSGAATHTIRYNYTADPAAEASTDAAQWSIDETNGTITRIAGGTAYTYTVAVSGLNKGTTVTMPKYPFVNINPQAKLGASEIISGDGAVLYGTDVDATYTVNGESKDCFKDSEGNYYPASKTMAAYIYADILAGNTRQYTTFDDTNSAIPLNSAGTEKTDFITYMQRTSDDDGDRISTFATERSIELPAGVEDFAVVVIAAKNDPETTALLNRYIQLVTNTTTDYAAGDAYFNVDIKTCQYKDGSFRILTDAELRENAHLTEAEAENLDLHGITNKNGGFQLNNDFADSIYDTFTLLDVQFMDPFHTEKIAYHLYVPVYTVREMAVNFYAVAKTGAYSANSDANAYAALMQQPRFTHVDSLDTWMTHYFRYEYQARDITALLNSGNVRWNYNKTLDFQTFTEGATYNRLPGGSYMVLVDPNGGADQAYYANASDMVSYPYTDSNGSKDCWRLDLTKFKKNNPAETAFAFASFNRIIADQIEAKSSASGKYRQLDSNNPADQARITAGSYDVYVRDGSTVSYYVFCPNNDGTYNIVVKDGVTTFCEDYYLSIKVPRPADYNNELYYYQIETPPRYASSGDNLVGNPVIVSETNTLPNVKSAGVTPANSCEILIADLFNQQTADRMSVWTPGNNVHISGDNRTITVDLSVDISPNDQYGISHLNTIFHSFVLSLIRNSSSGTESDIHALTEDDITAKYSLTEPISESNPGTDCAAVQIDTVSNIINVQTFAASSADQNSIVQTLKSNDNNHAQIFAQIILRFDEEQLDKEFPEGTDGGNYGVQVQAASNLSFEAETLPHSSMTKKYNYSSEKYYIDVVKKATLHYVSQSDDLDRYDEIGWKSSNRSTLGVNGKSVDDPNRTNQPSGTGYMPVNTAAYYYVGDIPAVETARYVKLELSLYKKSAVSGGGESYVTVISDSESKDLSDYLADAVTFRLADADAQPVSVTVNENDQTIKAVLALSDNALLDGRIDVLITLNAKSGEDFTEYANYMVNLTADLYTNANCADSAHVNDSLATDYLIYTNAKVNPELLLRQSTGP